MIKKIKSLYAVPCAFGDVDVYDEDGVFFVTFETRDEDEALRLASCICGDIADKALVIINEEGEIFEL